MEVGERTGLFPVIRIRKAADRGHFNHGWLDTFHTFSFAEYFDREFMGFRSLRVINEDRVEAGAGFPTHPHRDMEIVTVVLEGALEHKDSMGNGGVIRPGDVQRMSAGTGVTHSEFNASKKDPVHLLQIWILPEKTGIRPGYEQKKFSAADKKGKWCTVASPDGHGGSVKIYQDAKMMLSTLSAEEILSYPIAAGRHAWAQIVRGSVELNGYVLGPSDGAAVSDERELCFRTSQPAEILLFDLP